MGNRNEVADPIAKSGEPWDCLECLCGSPQRVELLETLADSPLDLRSLVDELDIPRTTLQHNLSLLGERGWVERTPNGYTATPVGKVLATTFTDTLETVGRIDTLSPLLDVIDLPHPPDIGQFDDPSVIVAI